MKRASGVLLPVFSLPSKYGIGCFSKEAYKFIDQLKEAGQSYWQILPLGPTGYGDSPYQSFSTYAGNPYFIDLKTLIKEGLLTKKECKVYDFGEQADSIDYEKIYNSRFKVLKKAFERFEKDEAYDNFIKENAYWLEMCIRDRVDAVCDGTDILIPGIMEHIERAGIHSGDSISVYPAQSLTEGAKAKIAEYTRRLAKSLHVIGMINIQFIVCGEDDVYVICLLYTSRCV